MLLLREAIDQSKRFLWTVLRSTRAAVSPETAAILLKCQTLRSLRDITVCIRSIAKSPNIRGSNPTLSIIHLHFDLRPSPHFCVGFQTMASQFMRKISSIFHRSAEDRTLPLPGNSHNDTHSANASESPPPYSSASEAMVAVNKASPISPSSKRCLRICPHETLSFERLQRIATLPNFDQPGKDIDALKCSSQQHISGQYIGEDTNKPITCCLPFGHSQD